MPRSLPFLADARLAFGEGLVLRHLQCLVEGGSIVARVVAHDHRGLVRELGDEVLAAEFSRIHLQFARSGFNEAFDQVGGFRAARPAIGIDRRGVGVDRIDLRVDGGDVVLARQQRGVEIGRHAAREGREIGTHRCGGVHAEAGDLAVCVRCQFGLRHVVAAMGVGKEALGAFGRHFTGRPPTRFDTQTQTTSSA